MSDMSSFRIRPRFKHQIPLKKEALEKRIIEQLKEHKQFSSHYLPGHIYIKFNTALQHFWSPQLHLSFDEEEGKTIVRGLYGPNPTVWAIFFFSYLILGLVACFVSIWGFSVWSLGKGAEILWALPVIGIIALIMYVASQFGQKMAAQQMFDIHHFYENITKDKVEIS
ncbi:hypothetical protein [Fulvivirga lutea]|uniref:GTP-binding protein n=1 Tax=Fulvivirga lutea TaxID=2810512 RepID=A0A974WG92_9BACT|nr:hypothetical protein [Fulvivirga lutea]QSE96497.1 hypothetical protein JR347_12920 [Fulvivirga lutea]